MRACLSVLRRLKAPDLCAAGFDGPEHHEAESDVYAMPRLVKEKEAAEDVVGLPLATFREWVRIGKLPPPLADCDLYDVKALDAAVDRLSGLGAPANALDSWRVSRKAGDAR
jgi:hypothetical protein